MNQDDVDKLCTSTPKYNWTQQFANLYPDAVCNGTVKPLVCAGASATYCTTNVKLQDCPSNNKTAIYAPNAVPSSSMMSLAGYLETELNCTGYCGRCASQYWYSDCTNK